MHTTAYTYRLFKKQRDKVKELSSFPVSVCDSLSLPSSLFLSPSLSLSLSLSLTHTHTHVQLQVSLLLISALLLLYLQSHVLAITDPGEDLEDEFNVAVILVLQHVPHTLVKGRLHVLLQLGVLQGNAI